MRDKKKNIKILNELILKGVHISNEYARGNDEELTGDDHAFFLSSSNLITSLFGKDHQFTKGLDDNYVERTENHIDFCIGTLEAAKHAIEYDYMQKQELSIAGSVFDSTLLQAKELLEKKYKDPAAILGRVIVEDALRRLANNNDIAIVNDKGDNKKASVLNDELKKKEVYGQVQWRRVQTWLDIGNEAAHGNFDKIREKDVESLLKDVELFIEEYFGDNG